MYHTLNYNIKKSMFLKIYIIPILLISPLMMISCNSWFSIWMIMEINLISFIPYIIIMNKFYKELSIKYFIIQAISSSFLIFSSNLMFINLFELKLNMILIMNLTLIMKIGMPPFHMWFINLMNNMNWMNCLILSTLQKIIPMISLIYIFNKMLIFLTSLLSIILSSILNLNHQSIRIIMAYSSISHMSWMFMNFMISEISWMIYFLSYILINISIMIFFNKMNIYFINQLFMFKKNLNLYMLMNFFSISSFPPLFGFLMKWISINFMNSNMMQIILFIMILFSIFSFFFYMRVCSNFMMNYYLLNKIILINKFSNFHNLKFYLMIMSFTNLWIMSIWIY